MMWGPLANRAATKLGMTPKGAKPAKSASPAGGVGAAAKMAKPGLRKLAGGAMSKMTKGR